MDDDDEEHAAPLRPWWRWGAGGAAGLLAAAAALVLVLPQAPAPMDQPATGVSQQADAPQRERVAEKSEAKDLAKKVAPSVADRRDMSSAPSAELAPRQAIVPSKRKARQEEPTEIAAKVPATAGKAYEAEDAPDDDAVADLFDMEEVAEAPEGQGLAEVGYQELDKLGTLELSGSGSGSGGGGQEQRLTPDMLDQIPSGRSYKESIQVAQGKADDAIDNTYGGEAPDPGMPTFTFMSDGDEASAETLVPSKPPSPIPEAEPTQDDWRTAVDDASRQRVESALQAAAAQASSSPLDAARSLRTHVRAPVPAGQIAALRAAEYAMAGGDALLAATIAEQGLALGGAVGADRSALLVILQRARASLEITEPNNTME